MFKNIYINNNQNKCFIVKLEDDNFEEFVEISFEAAQNTSDAFMLALIKIYSERKLNVAANIAVYLISIKDQMWFDINYEINEHCQFVKDFTLYKDDIEKYLSLI